ncbi:MAG TPA: GNAT family N-acetyltransferase [Actinomycetota bacterium]|nr:GNAT family N-acetyltransferase [Actinomycetota bacterium]
MIDAEWLVLREVGEELESEEALALLRRWDSDISPGPPNGARIFYLAEFAGDAVPAAAAVVAPISAGIMRIVGAAVAPAARGRGVGRRLFAQLFDVLRAEGHRQVVASPPTRAAGRFLVTIGFRPVRKELSPEEGVYELEL